LIRLTKPAARGRAPEPFRSRLGAVGELPVSGAPDEQVAPGEHDVVEARKAFPGCPRIDAGQVLASVGDVGGVDDEPCDPLDHALEVVDLGGRHDVPGSRH
jgi:hypothetical protein